MVFERFIMDLVMNSELLERQYFQGVTDLFELVFLAFLDTSVCA